MSKIFTKINSNWLTFQRNWTKEERKRFEQLYCAQIASNKNILPSYAIENAFEQMVILDNFYTQTQTTENE